MINVLDKFAKKIKTQFYVRYFSSENLTVYKIMTKNTVEIEGPQMTSQYGWKKQGYMHVRACTRPRARVPTRTHARPLCG